MADGSSRVLDFGHELVVDLFAGGGGASLGIARAYRHPDVAVNHNPVAIAVHQANHPETLHYTCDVFEVDPLQATQGRPVAVLWASPDCRHHSKAKGGKPRSKKIRGLAWVVIRWAAACKPRLICLENVEEFADWGPLLPDGSPCKARKGMTFRRWKRQLEKLGYVVEHRELVAADYGAPTIRKRLYVIARCDGRPITWPTPTHAKRPTGKLQPWRSAAECIDFSLPATSIFARTRPLADNTCRRIAKGLWRYVLTSADPFIVPLRGTSAAHTAAHAAGAPLSTITGGGTHHALVAPHLTEFANASNQRTFPADEPLRTQVAQVKGGHFALVAASLIQTGYGERPGQAPRALDLAAPLGTVVAEGVKHAVALAYLSQASGGPNGHIAIGHDARAPVSTITGTGSHQQLVSAYLVKYYGNEREGVSFRDPMHTVTTKDRLGVVQVTQVPAPALAPELLDRARACAAFLHRYLPEQFPEPADLVLVGDMVLVDITLRMLAPRELARAQGFPDSYVIERGAAGEPITKTDQVRLIGNSVCPDVAEALIRANAAELVALYARAA
jgi:DNA (cytosine-5)-methyltransferase 1